MTRKKSYHHGNLRPALIEAAHQVLAAEGVEGLSLRKVAQYLGVSAPALYSHFADKRALLAELATQGFEELAASMQTPSVSRATGDPGTVPDLHGLALAYVNFSLANPALYRLMFGREAGDLGEFPALAQAGQRCYGVMRASVAEQLRRAGASDDLAIAATAAWSMVHGLSTLLADGRVKVDSGGSRSREELILRVCGSLGFAAGPRASDDPAGDRERL